jgi:hypothetical protein
MTFMTSSEEFSGATHEGFVWALVLVKAPPRLGAPENDADSYTLRIYSFWFYSNASGGTQGAGHQLGSEVVLPCIRSDRFGLYLTQKGASLEWSFLSAASREDERDRLGD